MPGSNLPPGCSVNDIPGNRPEDIASEEAFEWAMDHFTEMGLDTMEVRRAATIGAAAVIAERKLVQETVNDAVADARMVDEMQPDPDLDGPAS